MAGFSDYAESALLALLFQNANFTNVGDATGVRGSTTPGNVWIALYTVAPSDAGGGTETVYTNYARAAVARSNAGWTLSGTNPTQVANAAVVNFPTCGATGASIVAFGIMDAATGGNLLMDGTISYTAANGNTPSFAIGALTVTLA